MKINWLTVTVVMSLVVGVVIMFAVHPYYLNLYLAQAPKLPVPETGHIYPRFEHGVIVYLSMRELIVLYALISTSVISFAILGLALNALRNRDQSTFSDKP